MSSLVSAPPAAQAAEPSFAGTWTISYYLEPNYSSGATQCVIFTTASGTVGGVATSGTWRSPTFSGWTGKWVQIGDHVRWFGVTSTLATEAVGNLAYGSLTGGLSFTHFNKSTSAVSSTGNWYATRRTSCPSTAQAKSGGDPAQ
jgi:hypothetical protein